MIEMGEELQVLGAESKQKNRRRWVLGILGFVAVITVVAGLSLIVRYAIKGALDYDEELMQNDGLRPSGDTTIIPALQDAVDSLLNDKLTEINGLHGQAIVMEVQTGEILAMAGKERRFDGKFQSCRNFHYQQELGALMQTASLLTLLEMGVDSSYVVHTENGIWEMGDGWVMRDHNWRRGGYANVNLARALEVSSNIGISMPIWKFYKGHEQDFFDDLNRMSFGQPDFIEGIEGLKPATYNSPKDSDWVNKLVIWSAIGYYREIAPIQMLTFYNAIANDGKMMKPTLKTGEIEIINPQIASEENIKKIQVILDHVVSQGLGRKAGLPLMRVAGKTGTSQVGEYEFGEDTYVTEYQVAFCGYFPADMPKFSIIVSMNKLGLPASGGGMAGVVFHNIVEWMLLHGMPTVKMLYEETGDTVKITSPRK